jgi:hypothetical protein
MGLRFVDILCAIVFLLSYTNPLGVSIGALVAGGVSEGHVNPVVWPFLGISLPPNSKNHSTGDVMHGSL